jgi:hypothetical protein
VQRDESGELVDHWVRIDGYTVALKQPNANPREMSECTERRMSSSSIDSNRNEFRRKKRKKEQPGIIECKIGQCGLVLSDFELVQAGHLSDKLTRAIRAMTGVLCVPWYQSNLCAASTQSNCRGGAAEDISPQNLRNAAVNSTTAAKAEQKQLGRKGLCEEWCMHSHHVIPCDRPSHACTDPDDCRNSTRPSCA